MRDARIWTNVFQTRRRTTTKKINHNTLKAQISKIVGLCLKKENGKNNNNNNNKR